MSQPGGAQRDTSQSPMIPSGIDACLFDLDGVLTRTAVVHGAAWKEMLDAFLRDRAGRSGEEFRPFEDLDYVTYVDGRIRADGVRAFLASRGIDLAEGRADDPPTAESVHGLGARKNALVIERIRRDGVEVYDESVDFVRACRDAGLRLAVVSASRNCREVIESVGIADLFEVRVDGVVAAERDLRGKPAPDTFVAAAEQLDAAPSAAAVFEDAVAGIEAGRAGGFGWVVGVDRTGQADALRDGGADIVVGDLGELLEQS